MLVTDGLGVVGSAAPLTVEPAVVTDVTLTVRLAAGKVVIAWPTTAVGFSLQYTLALPAAAGDWKDETTPAVQSGANWEVQLDPIGTQRYYRLIH